LESAFDVEGRTVSPDTDILTIFQKYTSSQVCIITVAVFINTGNMVFIR